MPRKNDGTTPQSPFDHLRRTISLDEDARAKFESAANESSKKKPRGARGKGRDSAEAVLGRIVDSAKLFLDQNGKPAATVFFDDHCETFSVSGERFKQWLITRFVYEKDATAPTTKLREAIDRAAAKAIASGTRIRTWRRVGWGDNGKHYIDLGGPDWRMIEADNDGWRVVANQPARFAEPPIRFVRSGRELPLPDPISPWLSAVDLGLKGDPSFQIRSAPLRHLLKLVRAGAAGDGAEILRAHRLLIAFMFDCLRPGRDHAILNLLGPPGASKTSAAEAIASVLDPREPAHTSVPEKEEDLLAAASARHVYVVDNASKISPELSDAFCRLTTGAGSEKRALYTDGDVAVIRACCPVIVTSITTPTLRDDFQRRTINLRLRPTLNHERLSKEDVEAFTEAVRPAILGALLDAVVLTIQRRDETKGRLRGELPAMADFALWVEGGAPALGFRDGQFLDDYRGHKQAAVFEAAESDDFVQVLIRYLNNQSDRRFEGSAGALLDALREAGSGDPSGDAFPRTARFVGDLLDAKAALLAAAGVTCVRRTNRRTKRPIFTLGLEATVPRPTPDALFSVEGRL